MMRLGLFIFALMVTASPAGAQRISLPLEGYYRPGHFMPVRVDQADGGADVHVEATGAMATHVRQPRGSVIVPVLIQEAMATDLRATADGRVFTTDAPLRALTAGQRLVGATDGLQMGDGADQSIVRIRLDPLDPLPGPAIAWTGLDILAVEPAAYPRIRPDIVDDLLASGVKVMVRASDRPDDRPWRATDGWQVLEPAPGGPRGAPWIEAAYLPTYGWSPGWPAGIRRMVAMVGVGIGILGVGATFLGRWRGIWGVVIVATVGLGAGVGLRAAYPPVFEMGAAVAVPGGDGQRIDTWSWQKSRLGGEFAFLVRGPTWPIFASREHGQRLPMHLRTAPDGRPIAYVYRLLPNATMGFVTRTSGNGAAEMPDSAPPAARLNPMVQRIYGRLDGIP